MTTNQIHHEVYSNPLSDQPITYLTKVVSHQELSVTTIDTKEDLSDPNEFDEVIDLNSSDPNYFSPPFLMNHQPQHSFMHYQSESHDTHETMSPYLTSETHNNSHNTSHNPNNSSPHKSNHHMLDTSSHTNPLTSYDYHPSHLNNNMRDNNVSNHSSPTTTSNSASPVLTNPSLHLNINNIIDNFSKRYEDIYIKSNSKSKKAHFDCIPKDNNVVDGAKMTWCPLLLFDAMINFLYSDNYRPQTRRVFNQQDVLYTCILEELQQAANQQLQPDLTDCFLNGQLKPLFQTLLWQMNLQNPINSSVGTTLDVSMYAPFLQSPVPEIQLRLSALKQLEFNEKELFRSYLIMHFLFYSEDFSIQFPNNMILPTLTFSLTYSKWLHLHHMKTHLEENAPSKAKNKHIAITNFFLQSPFLQTNTMNSTNTMSNSTTNSSNSFFLTTPLSGLFQMVICKVIYLHAMKDFRKESSSLASNAMVVQALVPRSLSLKASDYPTRHSRLSTHGSERLDKEQAEKNLMLSRGERHLYNNKRYAKREHAMLQCKDMFAREETNASTKDIVTEDLEVKRIFKRVCRVSPSTVSVGTVDPENWRKQFLHKLSPYMNDDVNTSTYNTTENTLHTPLNNMNMAVPRYASVTSVGSSRTPNNGLMHCPPTETSDSETSEQFSYEKHHDSTSFHESHNNSNDHDQFMGVYDPTIFSNFFDSQLLASSFVHPNKDKELEYFFERLDKNHLFPYEMSSSASYFPPTSSLSASSSNNLSYSQPINPHNSHNNTNYLPVGYFDGLPAQETCSPRYVLLSLTGNPYNHHPSYPSNSDLSANNSPNQLHENTSHKHY